MLSLVYVSSARELFSDDDLKALLQQSRDKNTRLGLTGMLLYKDGNFMQLLEGSGDAVMSLYSVIERDPRHRGVLIVLRREIEARVFPDWSMGFKNLDDAGLADMPGYNSFMNEPLTSAIFRADPARAQSLLEMFRARM